MKKYLIAILSFIVLLTMPLPVYAKEVKGKCNVTFYITDETGDYPGTFTAKMTSTKGKIKDHYKFTKGNSWGGAHIPKYTMAAPATYTVTFEGIEDGYKVVTTLDHVEDIKFDTSADETVDVMWSIIKDDSTDINESDNSTKSDILEEDKKKDYIAENEGADKVYKNFLSATAFIADDQNWKNNLLQSYELFPHEERYESYVEGGTKEEYLSMSLYDRFVWSETYLKFAWAVNSGNFDNYFGSEENFASHITNDVVNMMKGAPDNEGVIEAYLKLADWQYDYVKKNGVPFNFINNRSYLDEVKTTDTEVVETEKAEEKEDKEELAQAANELLADADKETKKEVKEKGIWDDTLDALSNNIITIIIIIVLVIAVVVVIQKRKRLNIDDNGNGDTNIDSTNNK